VAKAAVLAIDYRLMPEFSREAAISDCQAAYRWLLDHSPEGKTSADFMAIAGDSADGNLVLVLFHWVRDSDLRKPDALVALSPMTDMLITSPTIKLNLHTDAQVGPVAEKMLRAPKPLLWFLERFIFRRVPSDPMASPVYADLFDLPPTLLHASESEVLLGDAGRYVNKAIAAGSPTQLQTWDGMPHVWHLYPELESTDSAWGEIGKFISRLSNEPGASAA
jgi:epsilon-lactone hydrolase